MNHIMNLKISQVGLLCLSALVIFEGCDSGAKNQSEGKQANDDKIFSGKGEIKKTYYAREAGVDNMEEFHFPAEFGKHEAIWLKWTRKQYEGAPTSGAVKAIINALAPYVDVKLVVESKDQQKTIAKELANEGIPDDHVRYTIIPQLDHRWMRDTGPIFIKDGKGNMRMVDFGYNRYGRATEFDSSSMAVEQCDRIIAGMYDMPVVRTSIVSEGGDREFNGKGVMMTTESVELQRNPEMTKAELTEEFKRIFGLEKVIWLKTGPIEGDAFETRGALPGNVFTSTTCGHIDEYARFAGENTIILAEVTEGEKDKNSILKETNRILEENYKILKNATDAEGNPFEIVRMPVTDHYYVEEVHDKKDPYTADDRRFWSGDNIKQGDTTKHIIASSYFNFLVTNGCVLVAEYFKKGRPESTKKKDQKAKKLLQKVFPDRKIIQISEAEDLNSGGGGIHCITQQEPESNMSMETVAYQGAENNY